MVNQGPNTDLWIYDCQTKISTRLTTAKRGLGYPVWSPDGQYIVFCSLQGISWIPADGTSEPKPLTESEHPPYPASFTADGKLLAYWEINPNGGADIWILPLDGSSGQQLRAGSPTFFRHTPSRYPVPAFSPDGKWLAYASAENGPYEVYVTALQGNRTKVQVSDAGGVLPVWSTNGHELFYRTLSGCEKIMVATYTTNGGVFKAERPRIWSDRRLANTGLSPNFDLAPDGKQFVVLMPAEGSEPLEAQSHVTLVVNFFDEVRRRAPGGY
jgi:serine/threonine-protein kinase